MSDQQSLVTTAARDAAAANAADYSNAVAQHISGDFGQHNQINVYSAPFPISALAPLAPYGAHSILNATRVRLVATINGIDYALLVPGYPVGSYAGGGTGSGGVGQTAPAFTTQPLSGQFPLGTNITLSVAVSGTTPILLQWTKNGVAISGATATSLSVPSFSSGDAANYNCIATNAVGQTISATAVLAVQNTPAGSGTPSRPGVGCFTKNTFVTLQSGVQQPIYSIVRGDVLRSYTIAGLNDSWRTFAAASVSATQAATTVNAVLKYTLTSFYRVNDNLEVTQDHPLLAKRGPNWVFVQAKDLRVGDYLFRNGSAVPVRTIVQVNNTVDVWSLDVGGSGIYFANGYAVHAV